MNTPITPGSWDVVPFNGRSFEIHGGRDGERRAVCVVKGGELATEQQEAFANAHAIAAAPDLLAAAKAALDLRPQDDSRPARAALEAAVAKAEGR